MTCVECGAEMGVAGNCGRCGAPVPELPQDEAPATQPVSRQPAKRSTALRVIGWTVGILVNLVALEVAIGFIYTALTEGSPAREGPNYVPLWACAFLAISFSVVPAVSGVVLVDKLKKRRAIASDSPQLVQERLD